MPITRKTPAERTPQELLQEAQQRAAAQEEVLQVYLKQIRDLQDKLKTAEAANHGNKALTAQNQVLRTERDMYRALIKGWPKGRKLVKLLTRDPYDS